MADRVLPLGGTVVLDLSRMLPGAVAARMLLDLGARVVKVEEPGAGDPLRAAPPLVGGVGAGFCALYRGAESVALDLRDPADAAAVRKLARSADVLLESFRPGTLERWDLGPRRLLELNPALVVCALSAFGSEPTLSARVGHDLNFLALSGLLDLLGGDAPPKVQIADVVTGLLGATSVLAALLARARTGRGAILEQPLASGPLPLLVWAMADRSAGDEGLGTTMLAGRCPAYRTYACGDGRRIAVAAIEPKFWVDLLAMLDIHGHDGDGLDDGTRGREAARRVEAALAVAPRDRWLADAEARGLPVSAVHPLDDALAEPALWAAGLLERVPCPGGASVVSPGPLLPSIGATPPRPAPELGEQGAALLRGAGVERED